MRGGNTQKCPPLGGPTAFPSEGVVPVKPRRFGRLRQGRVKAGATRSEPDLPFEPIAAGSLLECH
jgi:hypothetical protein